MNLENVRLIGRVMPLEDTLWMALSGTGVEFSVTGTFARITFLTDDTWCGEPENRSRVAVYVDEERVVDTLLDKPETVIAFAEENEIPAAVIGRLTGKNDLVVRNGEIIRYLTPEG